MRSVFGREMFLNLEMEDPFKFGLDFLDKTKGSRARLYKYFRTDKTDVQILREEDPLAIALRFDIDSDILNDWLKYCYIKLFEAKNDLEIYEAKSAVDILVYIKSFDNFFEENIPNLLIDWINIRSLIFLLIENLQEEQPDKSLNIKLINLFKNIIYKIKIFIEGKGGKIIGSKKKII
uniref:Uncharacterized protein n=1 Tax=Meloidogyne enterolobii TaxID=390850 RepID=A0A6V7VKL5_MELEN|nr:unnamed protein product [Meloidogyne enterolobii]